MLYRFIFLSICLWGCLASASAQPFDELKLKSLAESSAWRALLHYHPDNGGTGWRSQADDKAFFNAASGATDPLLELKATLDNLQKPLGDVDDNEHAQCRFPARYHWLKLQLPQLIESVPQVECSKFDEWYREMKPAAATLIFPAAYINSPSSMFGHTLVRIDGEDQTDKTRLLAYSISYAAEMPESVNSWDFVWGGLFGGYPGLLNGAAYYDKVIEYNDIEARDVWEYELNITPAELDQMIRHIWELQQVVFDYYFFDENCSFRLLTILDVARPGLDSAGEFGSHAIPSDTVRVLDDRDLLKKPVYRPSALSDLRYRGSLFSRTERQLALDLALGEQPIAELLQREPDLQRQAVIADYAFDYLRYLARRDPFNKKRHGARSLKLLSNRSQLPQVELPVVPIPTSPERGHGTARIAAYGGEREGENYIGIRARPAFHDVLDDDRGYVRGAQIDFLSFDGRYYTDSEHSELESFTLLDIKALSPRNAFFKPLSWQIKLGWQRFQELPKHSLRFGITGGGGITQEWGSKLRFSLMGLGNIRSRAAFQSDLEAGAGAESSLVWSLPAHSKLRVSAARWEYEGRHVSDGWRYSAAYNLPIISVDHSLRIEYQRDDLRLQDAESYSLVWNYYF